MGRHIDVAYIISAFTKIAKKIPYSVSVILLVLAASSLLAVLLTALRIRITRRNSVLNTLCSAYISFFRSTPTITHLFIIYYGIPALTALFGVYLDADKKTAYAAAALILYYTATVTEILRPAYQAVDRGQHEAAVCVGLTEFQKAVHIVWPQAINIAFPALGNSFIELVKDTAILYTIGLIDVMGKARQLINNTRGAKKLEVYIAVAVIYLIMNTVVVGIVKLIDRRRFKRWT